MRIKNNIISIPTAQIEWIIVIINRHQGFDSFSIDKQLKKPEMFYEIVDSP